MDRPRQNDHLGVNKIGKNIRKSPLTQPSVAAHANLAAEAARPQAQPQVYNINRSDFRSIVQQLTGSPSRESLPGPPQNNSPKPQNTRLQRIRPPPLMQINQPGAPLHHHHPHSLMGPPPPQWHMPQVTQQQQQQPMMGQGDQFWSNTTESPLSGYMRYLQSPLGDAGSSGNHMQPPGHEHGPYMPAHEQPPYMLAQPQPQSQHQPYMPGHENRPYMPAQAQFQPRQYMPGHEHGPYMPAQPQSQPQPYMPCHENGPYMPAQPHSQPQQYMPAQPQTQPDPYMMHGSQPQMNMQGPLQPSQYPPPPGLVPNLPPPQFNGPVPVTSTLPSPSFNQMYNGFHSLQNNGFGSLQSPTSQFGVQYPQPLTPNFSFSQLAQSGSSGPGDGPGLPQPPPSPGLVFPLSPGLFPVPSPSWGDY
ncbi:protein HAIKU1 isoform X2 [Brassica rapa]|uniref:protein HAIKU1 isoform X2 n=1 Tax=Brassica campestris TaxID=3711 RepID=UPI0004F19A99|nr:protein HAIKU1 isoform X2 [Brassica rapa]XP_048631284.1 protein HAIKU1-like isoform X2 [Brassica napus]